jgi:predicted acylesterase/phospholipase RssA
MCAATLAQPAELRVGVLFFQDENDPLSKLRDFAQLMPKDVQTAYAIGTYGELAHWLERGLVDVAVINPGLYARLDEKRWTYLGSGKTQDESELRTVWLTRKGGPTSLGDLKTVKPEILSVHPLSVSGFINPVSALQGSGLEIDSERVKFTHSHSGSLDALAAGTTPQIACVWEPTWKSRQELPLVEIELDGLNDIATPPMAIVGRTGSVGTGILKNLIQSGKVDGFVYDPNYNQMIEALPPPPLQWSEKALDRVDLDDLILTLRHYNRTHPEPARLGLVLAGGGAKCSYQAGAVRALEERLKSAREQYTDDDLDIHVVIGTSGGAINALSIAMGITKTADGYQDLKRAWLDLDQKEIVSPPFLVRLNMWLWFASVAGLGLLFFTRWMKLSRGKGLLLTSLVGFVMALLPRLPVKISHWLGGSAELQYFWTWLSFGIEGAGFVLLGAAALWEGVSRVKERRGQEMLRVSLVRWLTFTVTILPLIQTWTILWHEEVISENKGLETALLRNFGRLVSHETARRGGEASSTGDTIEELSSAVFRRGLLTRDLVLTASPLPEPERELPAEYYFYASAGEGPAPEFGSRGIALNEHPDILFDAMLGSAAIYPLFPARRVEGIPAEGQSVDLVDGSFAHRSPLEAAVEWGATHVLVLEASTQEMPQRGKFMQNMGSALTFLYDQAQLTDVRSEGKTVLYTLYPSVPHIGLLDFSAPLLEGSLEKGYREASGAPSPGSQDGGVLHKLQGPPEFWMP